MNLTDMAFVARPRGHYEAMGLGCQMACRWWRTMLSVWILITLPVYLLLWMLLDNVILSGVIFWWLKPLFERTHLYVLSRSVFGAAPTIKEVVKAAPKIMSIQWFTSLTWRRFSLTRSFDLALIQLEGLSGEDRTKRLVALHRDKAGTAASWLTVIGVHLESLLQIAASTMLFLVLPETDKTSYTELLNSDLLNALTYYAAVGAVSFFYVSSGFALYLNRRIILEGWDIELNFRRLTNRLDEEKSKSAMPGRTHSKAHLSAIALIVACFITPLDNASTAYADTGNTVIGNTITGDTVIENAELENAVFEDLDFESNESTDSPEFAKQTINDILQGPDFRETDTVRIPAWLRDFLQKLDYEEEDSLEQSSEWVRKLVRYLADFFEIIIWLSVGAIIFYIAYRYRNTLLNLGSFLPAQKDKQRPTHVLDMDIREAALPENIAESANGLWASGQEREAMALLYRAGLSKLVYQFAVEIPQGATEADCVSAVSLINQSAVSCQSSLSYQKEFVRFFTRLTEAWKLTAYAHQLPDADQFDAFCAGWETLFNTVNQQSSASSEQAE